MRPAIHRLLADAEHLDNSAIADAIEALIAILDARTPDAEAEPDDDGEADADDYVLTKLRAPGYFASIQNEMYSGNCEDMEIQEEGCCEAAEDQGTIPADHPHAYRWRREIKEAGLGARRMAWDFAARRGRAA